MLIVFVCKEGERVEERDREVLEHLGIVKTVLDMQKDDHENGLEEEVTVLPLHETVDASCMREVLRCCATVGGIHHVYGADSIGLFETNDDGRCLDVHHLLRVAAAADYLDVPWLVRLACRDAAYLLSKSKSERDMCELLAIKPCSDAELGERRARARQRYPWAFDD